MTTDPDTARKALSQLISTVEGDTRYYPKAKIAILSDLKIVSDCLNTDPLTITETIVHASQRLRVNLYRFRPSVSAAKDQTIFMYSPFGPSSRVTIPSITGLFTPPSHIQRSTDREHYRPTSSLEPANLTLSGHDQSSLGM